MIFFKKTLLALGLLFGLSTLAACATTPLQPVQGQVLEEGTNKPVANALVVGRWMGTVTHGIVESRTVCYHVESTTTDAEGRFTLPPTEKEYKYRDGDHYTSITVYKLGYEAYLPPGYARSEAYRQNIRYLQPFAGGREERLKYLERAEQSIRTCRSPQAEEKNLLPLYRAFYEEAKSLAKTKEDQKIADGFLAGMEIIELGYKEGMRRALERAEKRDRQP
jgi:hypothetical protein